MLVLGALVRLVWIVAMPVPPVSDFATFRDMVDIMRGGGWWADAFGWIFQGPLYPALGANIPRFTADGLFELRLFNVALQLATAAFVFVIARRLQGPRCAVVAAGLCAILPGLWTWTTLLAAENLGMALVTGITACLVVRPTTTRLAGAGAGAAALMYTRPAFLLFPVVLLGLLLLRPADDGMRRIPQIAAFLLGLVLVAAPIANANVTSGGDPLPTAGAGWQPWLVYNERATGGWWPAQSEPDYPFAGLPMQWTAGAQRKLALQYVLANPGDAISSVPERLARTWSADDDGIAWTLERTDADSRADALRWINRTLYFLIVVSSFLTAVAVRRQAVAYLPLIAPIAYLLVLQVVSEGNARYHVPVLPLVAVLATGTLAQWRTGQPMILATAATLTAAAWVIPILPWLVVGTVAIVTIASFVILARSWPSPTVLLTPRGRMFGVAVLLALFAGSAITATALRSEFASLRAVDPAGWETLDSRGNLVRAPIVASTGTANKTAVSYPAAVRMPPDSLETAGAMLLTRTLNQLHPGESYLLYLQLWNPDPDAEAHLSIRINGRIVWRGSGEETVRGWQYLAIPWIADAPAANVSIEARPPQGDPIVGDILVRGFHVYPTY